MRARAWRASPYGPLHEQSSRRALDELFLRPPRMGQDRRASEPRRLHEIAHRVESLRRAPSELAADDLAGAYDARRAGARSTGKAHTPECIGEAAHLLAARRVGQLRLGERFAPADETPRGCAIEHLGRTRSVPAL